MDQAISKAVVNKRPFFFLAIVFFLAVGYFSISGNWMMSTNQAPASGVKAQLPNYNLQNSSSTQLSPQINQSSNQKVFLMGGDGDISEDVWSSTGSLSTWTNISQNNSWLGNNFCAVYLNRKIFAIAPDYPNKVWSSANGVNWNLVLNAVPFGARNGYSCTVLNNKIWIAGGVLLSNNTYKNDVWSSPDGITWTEATAAAPWQPRAVYSLTSFQNKLWILGGDDPLGVGYNDVWSSPDGITWTEATAAAPWQVRYGHTGLVFNDKLWILGGFSGSSHNLLNDVWSSPDGVTWTEATAAALWQPRMYHQSLSFGGKLWILGGSTSSGEVNDVWSSRDGIIWTPTIENVVWTPRAGHQVVITPSNFGLDFQSPN